MEKEKKFKEQYINGDVEYEDIDDFVDAWNNSNEDCTLREYLGLNAEEEDVWIDQDDEALRKMLDAQRLKD